MSNIGKLEVSSIIIYYYSFLIGYASGEEGVSCLKLACLVQNVLWRNMIFDNLTGFCCFSVEGKYHRHVLKQNQNEEKIYWVASIFFETDTGSLMLYFCFILYLLFNQLVCQEGWICCLISVFWCWKFNPNPTMLTLGLILRDRK